MFKSTFNVWLNFEGIYSHHSLRMFTMSEKQTLLQEALGSHSNTCTYMYLFPSSYSRKKILAVFIIFMLSCLFILLTCLSSYPSENCNIPSTILKWHKTWKQRPPSCIIIGVRKAGTGALRQFLEFHPNVSITKKEPNFFSFKYDNGIDWYLNKMPYSFPWQVTMEKSSNNFHNKDAPRRTFKYNNNLKLIVVVRDPVNRAISDYTQRVINSKIHRNFETDIYEKDSGLINESYTCLKPSYYYKHLKRWLKYFPLHHIHVVDGEKLVTHPYEQMYKVENFLNLPHFLTRDKFVYNESKGFYCYRNFENEEHCLGSNKGREHEPVTFNVLQDLHQHFKPKNEQFFLLIGERFEWGY